MQLCFVAESFCTNTYIYANCFYTQSHKDYRVIVVICVPRRKKKMSGGRVSIPNNVRKTIQNIKEITGNHSEDEIYAMLKDCSMDPNETAQKLLLQDPFHEVKRKRDRKKEILNKEPTEPRGKPGLQGRGNRGGRVNHSPRNNSNEGGGSRKSLSAMENGTNQGAENGPVLSMPQGQRDKETFVVASSSGGVPDKKTQSEVSVSDASNKLEGPLPQIPPIEARASPTGRVGSRGPLLSTSASKKTPSPSPSPSPGVYLSGSDPILMPSHDSRPPVGTIRREVRNEKTPVEQVHESHLEIKSPAASGSEVGNSCMQGKAPSEFQGAGKNHVSFSIPRPSSNYNNRIAMQQTIGPQKVGPGMEWKPKPRNHVLAQETGSNDSTQVPVVPVQVHAPSTDSEVATHELEKKLEELHFPDNQHVIIPNHLHVPEAEKLGFCFGSFDAGFSFNLTPSNGPVSDKSSEVSEVVDESIEEQPRNQIVLSSADEGDHPDRPSSSSNVPEKLSPEIDISSNSAPEHHESKQQTSLPSASHQYPVVHTSPNFSFGFIPPMIGTHITSFETNESQGRDGSHVPSFVQPIDPASYYAQLYRSGADGDGHMSPFHSTGVANKFSGNVPVLSSQASQSSSQEVGNSILSGAGPTPIASTQTGGFMQSSIAVTQQPLPVFRQPTGVHLSHYPPNYIPYAPYFSPFYVPPPAIHQFLSNATFAQQPQAPQVASPKYPLTQYKTGSNAGNPTHIGILGNYGPYGSTPAGYNPGSATTAANSTSNEDLGVSQFKESNVYITGQQSEGSGVWMAGPGRDISGLQANSFYNLPQGGQVAYTPTQATHGTFAGIYHPAQPVTTAAVHPLLHQSQTLTGAGVDMVGPTAQINWPNNY